MADDEQTPGRADDPAEPKAPPDPRLKVLKKFHGKFLPKGVLRERHKAIMDALGLRRRPRRRDPRGVEDAARRLERDAREAPA